ncbi:MAG: polysaccharide biosynthesis tyrosine autokinase, partial [Chloroflexi bacterium]|nr:polysaccharide biosynthesis tyrosine autokinase [Chloroflexota bacterium]
MELKAYIAPLRKWWWLILATTLMASVSSYLATRQQPPIYRASATLLIGSTLENPNPSGSDIILSQQLAQTYVDLAKLAQIREATMKNLGLTQLPEYVVSSQLNTQLIKIEVTDTSPERATAVANELANQLVLRSPTSAQAEERARLAFINQELDDLEVKIEETKNEITAKQQELAASFSARAISDLQGQITALETKLNTLQTNYATLVSSTQQGARNTISVIQEATLPERPVGPNKPLTILVISLIGFILAAGAAYLLEYLDDTIKSPDDIEKLSGLPTLSGIARLKLTNSPDCLITLNKPRSPVAEAFRGLRTAIQFSNVDKSNRIIVVTSANQAEGKSLVAANLAIVMAQAGHSTLLLDADLRRPVQHRLFDLDRNRGLTNLLLTLEQDSAGQLERRGLEDYIQPVAKSGLYVLTSGPVPPNPSELLGSAKMKAVLATLSTRFTYIILDTPPVLAVTDAVVLSTEVDSAMLIIDYG